MTSLSSCCVSDLGSCRPAPTAGTTARPKCNSRIILRNKKSLEQVQICVGVPSYPISHERRYVSYILNTLLGGGMSSRLFQNVREKQGLVYSIFSELNPFRDTGCCRYMPAPRASPRPRWCSRS